MPKRYAPPLRLLLCLVPLAGMPASEAFGQSSEPSGVTAAATPQPQPEQPKPEQPKPEQPKPEQPKPKRDRYGSPLDTLMTTRFRTDVPPAQDFVTQSRPDVKTLDYQPLTSNDPDRPKPRDAANLSALRAELEGDAVKNERKARALRPTPRGRTTSAPTPRP